MGIIGSEGFDTPQVRAFDALFLNGLDLTKYSVGEVPSYEDYKKQKYKTKAYLNSAKKSPLIMLGPSHYSDLMYNRTYLASLDKNLDVGKHTENSTNVNSRTKETVTNHSIPEAVRSDQQQNLNGKMSTVKNDQAVLDQNHLQGNQKVGMTIQNGSVLNMNNSNDSSMNHMNTMHNMSSMNNLNTMSSTNGLNNMGNMNTMNNMNISMNNVNGMNGMNNINNMNNMNNISNINSINSINSVNNINNMGNISNINRIPDPANIGNKIITNDGMNVHLMNNANNINNINHNVNSINNNISGPNHSTYTDSNNQIYYNNNTGSNNNVTKPHVSDTGSITSHHSINKPTNQGSNYENTFQNGFQNTPQNSFQNTSQNQPQNLSMTSMNTLNHSLHHAAISESFRRELKRQNRMNANPKASTHSSISGYSNSNMSSSYAPNYSAPVYQIDPQQQLHPQLQPRLPLQVHESPSQANQNNRNFNDYNGMRQPPQIQQQQPPQQQQQQQLQPQQQQQQQQSQQSPDSFQYSPAPRLKKNEKHSLDFIHISSVDYRLFNQYNQEINLNFEASLDGKFYVNDKYLQTDSETFPIACYRRNYISLLMALYMTDEPVYLQMNNRFYNVENLRVSIDCISNFSDSSIDLAYFPSGSNETNSQYLNMNEKSIDLGNFKGNKFVRMKRFQFKKATPNNGKYIAKDYYYIVLNLEADIKETNGDMDVNKRKPYFVKNLLSLKSNGISVRGRNPSFYTERNDISVDRESSTCFKYFDKSSAD